MDHLPTSGIGVHCWGIFALRQLIKLLPTLPVGKYCKVVISHTVVFIVNRKQLRWICVISCYSDSMEANLCIIQYYFTLNFIKKKITVSEIRN